MIFPRWNIDEFGKESISKINIEPGLDKKITNDFRKNIVTWSKIGSNNISFYRR